MSIVDINRIINGTPQKVFINSYSKMKENYNEASALEFFESYNDKPFSFILENSRYIFSEPYYGLEFYKEHVLNNALCSFSKLLMESEKVKDFLEEKGSLMNESQREIFEDLDNSLNTLLEHTKNTRIYADYIKETIDDTFEEKLSDILFDNRNDLNCDDEIINLFESVDNPVVFFTYAPYVMSITNSSSLNNLTMDYCEKASIPDGYDEEQWSTYVETALCGNKLSNDDYYLEAVKTMTNKESKIIFEHYMNSSFDYTIQELVEERVKESEVIYSNPLNAVNNLFFDMNMNESVDIEDNDLKIKLDTYKGIIYESSLNILTREYQMCVDTDEEAKGYSVLKESVSIEEAMHQLNDIYTETVGYMIESSDDEDDDIEDDDTEDEPEETEPKDREIGGNVSGKKPKAPKPKNLANRIQFNAMDKEAKWQQRRAIRKQKGQERFNAAKAVARVPMESIRSMKDQLRKLDKMDEQRRKDFMTEPGFRKKAVRNLKLAILYGGAAKAKLALVPFIAITRHFSKKKDRRVRNELIREIETQIKVTDEKINDAQAEGDKAEKYNLIRIKDRLSAELVRVKTNSKYV